MNDGVAIATPGTVAAAPDAGPAFNTAVALAVGFADGAGSRGGNVREGVLAGASTGVALATDDLAARRREAGGS